jgi:hypothetical protein
LNESYFSTDDQAEEDKQPEQPDENNLEQATDTPVNDTPDDNTQ